MKRAVEASQPPGPPTMFPEKAKPSPTKVPSPAAVQLKDSSKTTTPNKDSPASLVRKEEASEPISQQRKPSTPLVQQGKPEPFKEPSPTPGRKLSQEKQQTGPKKPPDTASQPRTKQSDSTPATQQESGGFFGFGGPKSQPDNAKPAVTEKMFGFGSSIFSSASTLITSAVQDQPKTPPVSPKMSPAKDIRTSQSAQKLEQQKKTELPQQTKTAPPQLVKLDKAQIGLQGSRKASGEAVKPDSSTCPLCKIVLNLGAKDPPNYNTCTECKTTVCNQCGFNPMPNETGVSLKKQTFFEILLLLILSN